MNKWIEWSSRSLRLLVVRKWLTLNWFDLILMVLVSTQSSKLPGGLGLFDCCSLCWPQGECYKPRRLRRTLTAALTSTEANLDDKFPEQRQQRPRGLLIHQKSFYDFILTTFGLEQSTNFESTTHQQNPQQTKWRTVWENHSKCLILYNMVSEASYVHFKFRAKNQHLKLSNCLHWLSTMFS